MRDDPAWIAVAGGSLPLWRAGSGDGPLILFVHGWTLEARIWAPQFEGLSQRRCVAAFDRRGFGRSTAPPDPSAEIDDIATLLDTLGEPSAVIVGLSQGARSVAAFAVRHPDRVSHMALVGAPSLCASPDYAPRETLPIDEMRDCARRGDWDGLRAAWSGHDLLAMPGASADARAVLDDVIEAYRGRDLMATRPALELDLASLAQLEMPTLIVTGALEGPARQMAGDALASIMPNARRERIDGACHLSTLSHAAHFNLLLDEFLSGG